MASIYNAVVSSPNWSNTVLIINFDEWGGFFDHVPPPIVQIEPAEQALLSLGGLPSDGRLGFRVPCLVISPWSRGGNIATNVYDHTSVLKLIEIRWGLQPLTVRDENAKDLADVLDFDHPDFTHPPKVIIQPGAYGGACERLEVAKRADGSHIIIWDATCRTIVLQTSPFPFGPWSDVIGAVSPYVLTPSWLPQFFRFKEVH